MADLERFGVSIDADLLKQFDKLIQLKNYQSRSEALRDLIREQLNATATHEDPNLEAMGTLTLFYDHTRKDLSDRLTDVGHDHHQLVLTTLHFHLDHERCMEVLALKGPVAELNHFADHVSAMKGIQHAKLVITALAPAVKPHRHRGAAAHTHSHR